MRAYVVVRVIEDQVYGQRFNGQYSFYNCTRGAEVFFSKRDAEAAVFDWDDSKCQIISLEIPELVQPSVGAAVARWAKKVCEREGYYPSVKCAKEKAREIFDQHEHRAVRTIRKLAP